MPDRYEARDLPSRIILLFLVGIPIIVLSAVWVTAYFPGVFAGRDAGLPEVRDPGSGRERAELRAEEERLLNSYGWVDREAGLARIPVQRAMELFLQEQDP